MNAPERQGPISHSALRARALQGGVILVVRQALGMVISMVTLLFVTRVIGPKQYGIFASAWGVVLFTSAVGNWGVDVYLLRRTEELSPSDYAQGFTLLLCIGSILSVLLAFGHNLIAAAIHVPALGPVLLAMVPYILLNLLAVPGVVQLDRALRFQTVAMNEVVSQILNVFVAVPMAMAGAGAWAPACGMLIQQASLLSMTYWTSGFRPSLTWNRSHVREMLSYGLSYSSSIWLWQLRTLINPILVARFAGVEAVGIVALAIRMADVLSFAKSATWRIAMAALSKLGERRDLLKRSIEESMRLQVIAVGFPMAAFSVVAASIFEPIFGHRWDAALQVFPFIAIGYLANAIFNMGSSVLYLLRQNWQVTGFHVCHVALFAATVAVMVPRVGYIGYGLGEIAALLSYFVLHASIVRAVGSPNYGACALWFIAAVLPLVCSEAPVGVRIVAASGLLLPLLVRNERRLLGGYARILLSRGNAAA